MMTLTCVMLTLKNAQINYKWIQHVRYGVYTLSFFKKNIIVLKILKQMIANNTWMKLEDHCWLVICSKVN
jgi:hypothetical protein